MRTSFNGQEQRHAPTPDDEVDELAPSRNHYADLDARTRRVLEQIDATLGDDDDTAETDDREPEPVTIHYQDMAAPPAPEPHRRETEETMFDEPLTEAERYLADLALLEADV